jgi:hypothetical protein
MLSTPGLGLREGFMMGQASPAMGTEIGKLRQIQIVS